MIRTVTALVIASFAAPLAAHEGMAPGALAHCLLHAVSPGVLLAAGIVVLAAVLMLRARRAAARR